MKQQNIILNQTVRILILLVFASAMISSDASPSICFGQSGTLPPLTTPAASPTPAWTPSNTVPSATPSPASETLRPIRVEDVVAMNRAGIDETIMGDQVRRQGFEGVLSIDDLILLKQEDVPTSVVRELQLAAPGARAPEARPAPARTSSSPVPVIQERAVARPAPTVIYQTPPPVIVRPHYMYSYPTRHYMPHGYHPPLRVIHPTPSLQFHFRF